MAVERILLAVTAINSKKKLKNKKSSTTKVIYPSGNGIQFIT